MCYWRQEEGRPERFAVCGFFMRTRGQRARARRSQEKLAGWLNCWVGKSRRALVWSATGLPRAERDWSLEIGRGGADFTLSKSMSSSSSSRSPAACSATTLHPTVTQYLQWQHRTRRFVQWSRRDAALCVLQEAPYVWGRCCCWQRVLLLGGRVDV